MVVNPPAVLPRAVATARPVMEGGALSALANQCVVNFAVAPKGAYPRVVAPLSNPPGPELALRPPTQRVIVGCVCIWLKWFLV